MELQAPIDHSVFLDASYVIALINPKDNHHAVAIDLADQLISNNTRLVSTLGVVLEIGNALAKSRHRNSAVEILASLMGDTNVHLVPLSAAVVIRAYNLYASRKDKEWGLTDCCSFIVMTDQGLGQALTADVHFIQAGFQALLLDKRS